MEAPDERILAGILKGARWHGLLEPVREGRGHDCERGGFVALNGVPNPEGELSPGIYCTVELKISAPDAVPDRSGRSDRFDPDVLHVMFVEDGVAHSRKITEIRDLGTEVEVSDGVKQGNHVAITPPSISRMAAE